MAVMMRFHPLPQMETQSHGGNIIEYGHKMMAHLHNKIFCMALWVVVNYLSLYRCGLLL